MKWVVTSIIVSTILGSMMGMSPLWAQSQFVAPGGSPVPVYSPPPPPLGIPRPQQRPTMEGVIPQLFRLKKPWELINPFAPPEYGNGSANTAKDPADPSIPKGIIFFGLTW